MVKFLLQNVSLSQVQLEFQPLYLLTVMDWILWGQRRPQGIASPNTFQAITYTICLWELLCHLLRNICICSSNIQESASQKILSSHQQGNPLALTVKYIFQISNSYNVWRNAKVQTGCLLTRSQMCYRCSKMLSDILYTRSFNTCI
jgi:hypothetical protein